MAQSPAPQQQGSTSQIIMMMMIFGTMFVMFDPGMRNTIGDIAGIVLRPIIGFDENYPVMTVFLAGFCLVTFSSIVRDYFIDWMDSAERQAKMKEFNKILKEARLAGNDGKVKRLQQQQMDMSKDQMQSTMEQMKPMMFTMIFLVATFAFIGAFIEGIPGATFSVPWSNNVEMISQAWSGNQCCAFTNWMLLYMVVSMSVSQVVARVLKLYKFSKMLENPESYADKPEPVVEEEDEAWDEADDIEADEDSEFLEISDPEDGEPDDDDETSNDDETEEYDDDELEEGEEVIKPVNIEG